MILLIIIGFLFLFYAALIIFYNKSWRELPVFNRSGSPENTIKFSIIIPARNEEQNIGKLLDSLQNQSYPKELFEVIVVDDHSTDRTAEIAQKYASPPTPLHFDFDQCKLERGVKLLQLQSDIVNSYKKKAIETAIAVAQHEWIVCTDADCVAPQEWLAGYAAFIKEKEPVFIAAPVSLASTTLRQRKDDRKEPVIERKRNHLLHFFQVLDFMTLQGITGASVYKNVHSMCNGANLAYKKEVFYEVNGFKGVDDIASGDDMLLMHKIWRRYPGKVAYLKSKDVIVETASAPSWKDFFNQRIRWASKAKYYDDKRIFGVLLLVYLFNFSFLVLLAASLLNIKYFYALLILWVAKTIIELPFMAGVSRFFNRQNLLKYFFLFQPLHIAYTIISGFLGSFGKYEWKGRRVK